MPNELGYRTLFALIPGLFRPVPLFFDIDYEEEMVVHCAN